MKSIIASLRSLTLPFGATTGQRIVLDGTTGTISVFDSNNNLRLRIGFNADSVFEAFSAQASEFLAGDIQAYPLGSAGAATRRIGLIIESGKFDNRSRPSIDLHSESFDGTIETLIEHIAQSHLFNAETGNTDILLNGISLPRGVVGYGRTAGPTVLSTTAGTFSDLVVVNDVPVIAGRKYKITCSEGHSLLSGGSGFAAADAWDFEGQMDLGHGAGFVNITPDKPFQRIRANIILAASRWPLPVMLGIFHPSVSEPVDFKLRATKVSGAATVTSTVDTNGGAAPHILLIEDIGLQ